MMRSPTLAMLPKPPAGRIGWPWTEESEQLPDTMPDGRPWPKMSIVTPLYNQEGFVEETIRSVLLQGYPSFEYFIFDGGSTDGSLALVEKYSAWLNWASQKGLGQSAALNRGFQRAQGELIGWQNSDDCYGPDNFKEGALGAARNLDFEIYHGTTCKFQDNDMTPPWSSETCEEFSQAAQLTRMCMMNQSMLFRRVIFERGVFLKDDLHYLMDQEFFWRLSLEGFRFKLIPAMIGYYRQHGAAKSTSYKPRADMEAYEMLRWLCRDKRLSPELRRRVRSQLRQYFLMSLRKARRSVPRKLVPELILPITS